MPAPDPFLEFLGSVELDTPAVSTGLLTIAARRLLIIYFSVIGMSGADRPALRFNRDSGSNYWSSFVSAAALSVLWVNRPSASADSARLSAEATTLQVTGQLLLSNYMIASKIGIVSEVISTGDPVTIGGLEFGGIEWVNTTQQITTIELRTAGGVNTLNAGTGFAVWGRDL